MPNVVYIATSLDGYIAAADGGLDWLMSVPNPEQSDYGYAAFIEGMDALVMGRNTFETIMGFEGEWPYDKRVFVLSNSLSEVPESMTDKAEMVSGPLPELVRALNGRGYNNLYIDGGRTIQSFLAGDLLDEMIITQIPILLGDGIPLFGHHEQQLHFELAGVEHFSNGIVQCRYLRDRSKHGQ